ncbi:hypothetical protein E1A91_D11G077100v1 [Gossypium mustelinum]|uniref:Protein kinase domain-containing protein n=1 Tax=Gossypium mustelinum TaxID=34275 RepID=A0A5D2SQ00_GOSMU|nr:hypothetical protein E1A91_D11G077100v1 [Gossypium mustelinum]
MKERSESGGGGYVRADQIDLKSLDEQLQSHHSRAWSLENNRNGKEEGGFGIGGRVGGPSNTVRRQEWEIDPSKLIIKSVIARGTFGTVHRGIYDGQDVAVKLLDWGEEGHRSEAEIATLRAAFTQEVVVWHKLDHPNVTKFIGATMGSSELNLQTENGHIGMPSNVCCVVVEYCPGGALKSYLIKNRRRKLAFKVVVQLALDLARGLSYLHSKKIVHRDVKTENMLLDKTRTLKIADFGVARLEASNPNDMTGETGTLGYMAPENLRPEIPRCCPSSLANVMKRCWDANPDRRPEMDEVVSMLEGIDTSKGGGMIPHDQPQGCLCFRRYRGP